MAGTEDLKPLRLEDGEVLGIELADSGEFWLRPRRLTTDVAKRRVGSDDRYVIDGVVHYDYWDGPSAQANRFFTEGIIPECQWSEKWKRHVAAATDTTAVVIARCWGSGRLVFVNDSARELYHELLDRFHSGQDVARMIAAFKIDGETPELPANWRERPEEDRRLSPYQRVAVLAALRSEGFSFFMDRGTGKTASAIQLACQMARDVRDGKAEGGVQTATGRMIRVLVVCPPQVRLNWQREFDKFATVPGRVAIIRGDLPERVRLIAEMIKPTADCLFSVSIMSYDTLVRTTQYASLVGWDLILADESHYFKDPRTNRWAAKRTMRVAARKRVIMTGTPYGNSPMDLWSQWEFLGHGCSGFSDFKEFKAFHGKFQKVNTGSQGVEKLVGLQNVPLLQERMARLAFVISKKEAGLNLPDKVMSVHEVQMTAYQADFYRRLQEQLAVEIEDKLSGSVVDSVTVNNVLAMLMRLAQVTSGFITFDAKVDHETGETLVPKRIQELSPQNPKVDALLELLQDPDHDPRAKCIVWCTFVQNIERVGRGLAEAGIKHGLYYGKTSHDERDRLVDAFNGDPEFKVLVCNPQTAGEGLNLLGYDLKNPDKSDTYCDMEVFFSSNWSAIQRSQAEDRAHRRGTRMPVQVIDLVVPGTIDEEILDCVTAKRAAAESLSDLRSTLARVLGKTLQKASD